MPLPLLSEAPYYWRVPPFHHHQILAHRGNVICLMLSTFVHSLAIITFRWLLIWTGAIRIKSIWPKLGRAVGVSAVESLLLAYMELFNYLKFWLFWLWATTQKVKGLNCHLVVRKEKTGTVLFIQLVQQHQCSAHLNSWGSFCYTSASFICLTSQL